MKTRLPGFFTFVLSFFLFRCVLCLPAVAQTSPSGASNRTMPATAHKLIAVKVTGSKHFTSDEVAAASGLPVGTVAHEEDLKKAARQLGESGAFSSITYTFSYSAAGTKLEFQVNDADKFVPAHFADFVWFTDEDLLHRIHERIPLFKGELPTSGRLIDQVSDVLQAMLVENAIAGHVEYLRSNGKTGQLESIEYNVAGVSIRIRHSEFPGASATELPLLEAAGGKLVDREYSREYMNSFIEHSVLPIFREHGYLKASCAAAQPKVVKPEPSESSDKQPPTFVDITFPVTPGLQYKVAAWDWSGNKAIPTDELQPLLHAKAGQIANTVQLTDDLHTVQELYGSRGYILASVKVNAEFDDVAGTVAYHLVVNEDSVFHMGELEFRGIDNNLTARLRAAWKIRPGEVYDAGYLQQFLPLARKLLPASLDWEVSTHVTALARDKTVDVDIQYTAKAPR
ncbi:MAG TPA: POTRA domain-containing protein [Candidatus Eremiobacteraceae bacterium]|nr:POTRA domain-containing protein [Candidatus Eremiobacteraceae bacterium]